MKKINRSLLKCAALGAVLVSVAGCVLEPYPEPYAGPPPGAVPVAPAPYYGAGPYYYPEYPPYGYGYGYGYGPSVGVVVGGGGGGYHHWR